MGLFVILLDTSNRVFVIFVVVGLIKFKRSIAVKFCPFVFFAPFVVWVSLFVGVFVEMFLTKLL